MRLKGKVYLLSGLTLLGIGIGIARTNEESSSLVTYVVCAALGAFAGGFLGCWADEQGIGWRAYKRAKRIEREAAELAESLGQFHRGEGRLIHPDDKEK